MADRTTALLSRVMAGVMGPARQRSRFQVALDGMKRRLGFTDFHAKEFRHLSGEFSGWPGRQCLKKIRGFGEIGAKLMEAATWTLPNSAFEEQYRNSDTPRKQRLNTKYTLSPLSGAMRTNLT
jgi:hypothetical protein